jgi:response regulator of citrate/malate metabolism/predicted regulator of Ras-like GTPase activity (Roadblock/LC7/MglB family)
MSKRILLVDDEELFLKSLQEGLEPYKDVFKTDICFSVNQAIKQVVTKKYDLVITDIRMPMKSGIDLLIFLREVKYAGKVMVMSAEEPNDGNRRIESYGIIDIIPKPFGLEWFKDKVIDVFSAEEEREKLVTFDSIDLATVMQVINLERKSSVLEIDLKDGKGAIYFDKGEIVNADYKNLKGDKAVRALLARNEGAISVKKKQGKVKRKMRVPFVEYMMEVMKDIDETNREEYEESEAKKKDEPPAQVRNQRFESAFDTLSAIAGFVAAGIYDDDGEMAASRVKNKFNFRDIGGLAVELYNAARTLSDKMNMGNCDFVEIHTDKYIFIHTNIVPGKGSLGVILTSDGNVGLTRHRMNTESRQLAPEFK